MLVYRIEHPTSGYGPYIHHGKIGPFSNFVDKMAMDHGWVHRNNHPILRSYTSPNWRSGCKSLKQLFTWFKGYTNGLHNLDFIIVVYNVTRPGRNVKTDNFQLIFNKNQATRITQRPIVN